MKVIQNLVLSQFGGIQIFLDKTVVITIYPAKNTLAFQGILKLTFYVINIFNISAKMLQIL